MFNLISSLSYMHIAHSGYHTLEGWSSLEYDVAPVRRMGRAEIMHLLGDFGMALATLRTAHQQARTSKAQSQSLFPGEPLATRSCGRGNGCEDAVRLSVPPGALRKRLKDQTLVAPGSVVVL
jgi:hypothetical protein